MTTPKAKPLAAKLAEIMGAISHVEKRGRNDHAHYDYATEADVIAALRPHLAAHGIMLIPSVVEAVQAGATKNGTPITRVKVEYTITDGNEEYKAFAYGDGMDTGDKAVFKAVTGANKYLILKLFQIPTGDDPEKPNADEKGETKPRPPSNGNGKTITRAEAEKLFETAHESWSDLHMKSDEAAATLLKLASRVAGRPIERLSQLPAAALKDLYAEVNQFPTKEA